jgi:hypothetical protein
MPRHSLALVAAVVATAVLAACGADPDGGPLATEATEAMMLETCAPTAEPLEVEVCRCAFEAVTEQYDAEELERLDRRLRDEPDQVPPEVQEAILDCTFEVLAPPAAPATTTTSAPVEDEG